MPAPSQIKASQINYEMGVSNTASIRLSNNWVQNVASIYPTSTNFTYGKERWGINFPGGDLQYGSYAPQYDLNGDLILYAFEQLAVYSSSSIVEASATFSLYANGTLQMSIGQFNSPPYNINRTWLTSGVNSDYYAQMQITSGTLTSGTSNTDLLLSTSRTWTVTTATLIGSGGDQQSSKTVAGNLIIKDTSFNTIITRPITFDALAVLGPL